MYWTISCIICITEDWVDVLDYEFIICITEDWLDVLDYKLYYLYYRRLA